jgi:AcrR family transcriptional regulator
VPRGARQRLDPALRRAQIVDAAARVFHGRDPAEVTFEEIAEAAGVSRALVYNYFGDRSGVLAAVYLRSFQRLDEQLQRALAEDLCPADQLRAIIACHLDFAVTDEAAWRLIGSPEANDHPLVQGVRRRRFDQLAVAWGGTPTARVVAHGLIGLLEAATLDWLRHRDCSQEEVTEALFAMLWGGLSSLPHAAATT